VHETFFFVGGGGRKLQNFGNLCNRVIMSSSVRLCGNVVCI
jgi:hypothetical protein